jgi:hypothetical protein
VSLAVFAEDKTECARHARYLAKLIRRDSRDALWRIKRLLSRLEEGEPLNANSAAVQLTQARNELSSTLRGTESIDRLLLIDAAQEQ